MKKIVVTISILSLLAFSGTAFAAAQKPADVSDACYASYLNGSTQGCTAAELQSADAANGQSAQASPPVQQPTNYTCPAGQTYSSTGNFGTGGCVPLPAAPTTPPNTSPVTNSNGTSGNGQLTYIPLEPLCSGANCASYGGTNGAGFAQYVQSTYQILVVLGSILAVVLLTIGGVRYMLSEATNDLEKSKKQMRAALWGLLIVVGSFLILYTLNPDLLKFNLNPQNSSAPILSPFPNPAPPNTALTTSILPAYQFSDTNFNTTDVAKQESQFILDCQKVGGQVIMTAGTASNTSAATCQPSIDAVAH